MRLSRSRATRSILAGSATAVSHRVALSRNASVAAEPEWAAVATGWVSVVMAVFLLLGGVRWFSAEEFVDGLDGLVVLLHLRDVAGAVDDGDLAADDGIGELSGVGDVGKLVLAAPDNQGAGVDPVQSAAQAPVGDRPGEFAGAAEGPDQAGDGGPLAFGVVRQRQHGLGGGAVRVVKQQGWQLVGGD